MPPSPVEWPHAAEYARTVYELALRRAILAIAADVSVLAQDSSYECSSQELAGHFEARLRDIRESCLFNVGNDPQFADEMSIDVTVPDLVKGVLPAAATACLYGPSGIGKTFLALDLAHSISLGKPFGGHPVCQGAVLYVALEGQSTVARRFLAARQQHGNPGRMVARLNASGGLGLLTDGAILANKIIAAAQEQSRVTGTSVRLVIIDTLAQALAGENDASVMSATAGHARRIAEELEATVLFVHHPGKDRQRGLRGSSALFAALDVVIAIEQRHTGCSTVRLEKSRDDAIGELGISGLAPLMSV